MCKYRKTLRTKIKERIQIEKVEIKEIFEFYIIPAVRNALALISLIILIYIIDFMIKNI